MRTVLSRRATAVAFGVLADMALGEPAVEPHPVRAFGDLMDRAELVLHRDRRSAGVLHAALGTAIGVGAGLATRSTGVATYVAVAQKSLVAAGASVGTALTAGDLPEARRLLPALVGRDPSDLDAGEISRAVVESLAENTVDAVVAPVLWAVVAGAPGALAYRAVNTMDATVGHKSDRYRNYGWASARLDDVANYLPARLTAALVASVRPRAARAVYRAVRTQAPAHPSPNSGVAEAAFAAALGVALGGVNTYGARVERRPVLGCGRAVGASDIDPAGRLVQDVTWALVALLGLVGCAG